MNPFFPPQAAILTDAFPDIDVAVSFGPAGLATPFTVTASDFSTLTGLFVPVNNIILTSDQDDFITAGFGDDEVDARDGDDIVIAGPGDDTVFGGAGDDNIVGGEGFDLLFGGLGADTIAGGLDDDTIEGNDGNDLINGDEGDDVLFGNEGDDVINGNADDDVIEGNLGNDLINGNDGNDTIFGDSEVDGILLGTLEAPIFVDDTLFGDAGDDIIEGQAGDDILTGGEGADVFVFNIADTLTDADGDGFGDVDVITDFNVFEDVIRLEGFGLQGISADDGVPPGVDTGVLDFTVFFNIAEGIDQGFTGIADNTEILGGVDSFLNLLVGGDLGDSGSIIVEGVQIDALGAGNFEFVG